MVDLVYCEPKTKETTNIANIERKKVVICECTGNEKVTFVDEDKIPSYNGELKSPVGVIWIFPNQDKGSERIARVNGTKIRKWVKLASSYHKIPQVLLALVLQNENAANAPEYKKWLQLGERRAQTLTKYFDKYIYSISENININFIKRFITGSTGLANMSDAALESGVKHSIEKYARPPIPTSVAKTIFEINTDNRISGSDWINDLYYSAAFLRYLIDQEFGNCFSGVLSYEQLKKVLISYNGTGNDAIRYGNTAINNLTKAINNEGVLYFYEK